MKAKVKDNFGKERRMDKHTLLKQCNHGDMTKECYCLEGKFTLDDDGICPEHRLLEEFIVKQEEKKENQQ